MEAYAIQNLISPGGLSASNPLAHQMALRGGVVADDFTVVRFGNTLKEVIGDHDRNLDVTLRRWAKER